MNKLLLVARHEFLSNIKRPSFLFAMFGIPVLTIGIMAIVLFVTANTFGEGEVEIANAGYVDRSGLLLEAVDQPEGWQSYESREVAQAALDDGMIDAYFILPEAYTLSGNVALYAVGVTPEDFRDEIDVFIAANIAAQLTSDLSPERLIDPIDNTYFMENTGRELSSEGFMGMFLVPFAFSMVLLLGIQLTSQFLMSGVVEEKGNRIMELLITSITPMQLFMGKLLGLGAIGLVQIFVWLLMGFVGLTLGANTEFLSAVEIPLDMVLISLVYFVLTYFLYAALLAGIGTVAGGEQESRQTAILPNMLIVLPFFFIFQFLTEPNGTIPILLTLFPFSAALSTILRMGFTAVPLWQILLSLGILLATTIFITWASAKVFRWALLLHGKKIGIRDILRVVRGNVETGVLITETEAKSA
ncbi:MAG: ABC transporter permease [Aggregatilineales bacterium]